jgi:hypothetical protein
LCVRHRLTLLLRPCGASLGASDGSLFTLQPQIMTTPKVTLQIRVIVDDAVHTVDEEDVSSYVAQAIGDGDCGTEPDDIVSYVTKELT